MDSQKPEKFDRIKKIMEDFYIDEPDRISKRRLSKIEALTGSNCPYAGVLFKNVPGYIPGYGCPVCKGLSYHVDVTLEPGEQLRFVEKTLINMKGRQNGKNNTKPDDA